MEIPIEDINKLKETIRSVSTYDFSDYSEKSYVRRIEKILADNKLSIDQLIEKMVRDSSFLEIVIKEITVNTTELFRDPKIWQIIKHNIMNRFADEPVIKIWHAGCSTGQEVYSMLMLLNELDLLDKAVVYGTDLNEDVLKIASKGKYKYRDISEYIQNFDVVLCEDPYNFENKSEVLYSKYLDINKLKDSVQVKDFLLEKPVFLKHDLVTEGNIFNTKFHIIMCRNVLIYFNHNLQNRLFEFFYENLYDNGCLIIGRHEGILGNIATRFKKKETIYFKKNEY